MYSKGQLVNAAYEEIALAGYVFDLSPEEIQTACRRLDAMMATWNGQGIRLGYALASDPADVKPGTPSGLPDSANEAVYTNLALRLCSAFGKTPARTTAVAAKQAYDQLLAKAVSNDTRQMQMPRGMPAGAGHRRPGIYRNPFLLPPVDPIEAGPDGAIDFN